MAENVFGLFLPTQGTRDLGTDKLDLTALRQTINNIAIVVNKKDTGIYALVETMNGQTFFPDPALSSATSPFPTYRDDFRKVINFGALPAFPAPGTKSVAHGINFTNMYTFTRIYGAATDPVGLTAIDLSHASPTLANNIEVVVDAVNVTITVGVDRSMYTRCVVVIEYIKN